MDWKRRQSELTHEQLLAALDRLESGKVIHVPKTQNLTRAAFAKEACVAEDTPFSRYRPGHAKEGQYRFPDVVQRFNTLRERPTRRTDLRSLKEKIRERDATIKSLDERLKASRRVVNAQEIEIVDLRLKNADLEKLASQVVEERNRLAEEIKKLRRERLKATSK